MKHLTIITKGLLLALCVMLGGGVNAWGETVTYSVASTSSVTTTGTAPEGSTATYKSTYTTKCQLTAGKSMTLTLSGYYGKKITSITLSMRSNASKGAGYLAVKAGSTVLSSIGSSSSGVAFNNSLWYGNWSTSYVDLTPIMTNDSYIVQDGEDVTIVIGATANSLYCQSFTLNYVDGSTVAVPTPSFNIPSGTYTETQTVKVDNYSSDYIYAYTTDGSEPAFSDLEVSNGTEYDHEAGIEISSSCTLKMIAVDGDGNTSSIGSATYTLPIVFASLEELAAANLTTGTLVTVSFTDIPIKDIFVTTAGYRNGVYFDIQKDGNDIEIYFKNVPGSWVKEGKLSGTITGTWKNFNGTWEIVPEDGWSWDELTYVDAPVKTEATLDFDKKSTLIIGDTDAYTVTYSGNGALKVESSDPSVATASIEGTTVTITPVAKGKTTITISAPSTENYYAVEKSYDLYVSAPLTPAANGYESVDFTKIEPYCSLGTGGSATVEDYEGTSFKMVFAKPQSSTTPTKYYVSGTAVRAYTGNTITITAAEEIQAVKVNYISDYKDDGEKVTGLGTKEVVITSSKTCRFTSIDVYYKGVTLSAKDGSDYYATFSSDKAVQFVDAIVYTVVVKGSALEFNEVASKQVPANEGVLIKTTGTKAAYIEIDEASTLEYHNLLPSSTPMKDSGYKYYKLAYGDWENKTDLGFYWGAENGGVFTPKAGGAYLLVPAETAVKAFVFGDIVTAIEAVENENAQVAIYDLSGRKVSKAVKGLYIINGKKVVK